MDPSLIDGIWWSAILATGFLLVFLLLWNRKHRASQADIAEARASSFLETLPEGLLLIDTDGRIERANEISEGLFGVGPRALRGSQVAELFVGLDLADHASPASRGRMRRSLTAIRAEGRFPAEISVALLFDGRRLMLVRDVTDALAMEAQLRQAQKMESLGRLAGGVAHDFNNHLTVILGESEALAAPGNPPEVIACGAQIEDAARRAAKLTSQLLSFSRKRVQDLRVLDLNRTIDDMESLLRKLLATGIEIETVKGSGLPRVRVDPTQMEQALINLTLNSRDAMPKGGTIRIETSQLELDSKRRPNVAPGRYVLVTVSDTGTGMSDEVREHAFEPFFSTKARGQGTGLGLAMVKGCVDQSGGFVEISSELDAGTMVRIGLPAIDDAADPVLFAPPVDDRELAGDERILVVEDDSSVRHFVTEALAKRGYSVIESGDAREALALIDDGVDLIVTDMVMPGGSGAELAERARERHPGLPVLYMTGYVEQGTVQTTREQEPRIHVLQKPFKTRDLLLAVRERLSPDA